MLQPKRTKFRKCTKGVTVDLLSVQYGRFWTNSTKSVGRGRMIPDKSKRHVVPLLVASSGGKI